MLKLVKEVIRYHCMLQLGLIASQRLADLLMNASFRAMTDKRPCP